MVIVASVGSAYAYDVATHAAVTDQAYQRSRLTTTVPQSPFITLGIYGDAGIFPKQYWDIQGSSEATRYVDDQNTEDQSLFESGILDSVAVGGTGSLRPLGWLMRGAIREDDIGRVLGASDETLNIFQIKNPRDDPFYPKLARPFHHFFDPAKNKPLDVLFPLSTYVEPNPVRAPDWAIGYQDSFAPDPLVDSTRRNHFSIQDAREAMWRALTGLRNDGTVSGTGTVTRATYWATTFRALGDVIHLVEDMAQPQHTRNDSHAGIPPLGDSSRYETRVENRITGKTFKRWTLSGIDEFILPSIDLGELAPVSFNRYSDYFSTAVMNVGAGKGMADYSNRGFFTIGTNLQSNSYVFPSNDLSNYAFVDTLGDGGRPITLVEGTVPDLVFPPESFVKLSAISAWDQSMTEAGGPRAYTLYAENYDDQARLLLPRAVAYSAGLIDYFFRGSLKIELPPEKVYAVEDFSTYAQANAGFKTFKVMVQNVTASITPPGGAAQAQGTSTEGKLVAVLRYRLNTCLQLASGALGASLTGSPYRNPDGTGNPVWSESCRQPALADQAMPDILVSNPVDLAVAAPDGIDVALKPVVFTFPTALPFNALDVDLQVIYRGPLGTERDGIAVGFEHINEPSFFNFDNNNDCFTDLGDKQCPVGTTDATCYITDSVKLPLPEAVDMPGWVKVASISNLKPGQYARVAFLTRSAWRYAPPADLEVPTNENFPYEVDITYMPDGSTDTWPPGPTIRSPLKLSRPLTGQTPALNMLEWSGHGTYKLNACANGYCDQYSWASTCPAIDPTPQPVQVNFPQ